MKICRIEDPELGVFEYAQLTEEDFTPEDRDRINPMTYVETTKYLMFKMMNGANPRFTEADVGLLPPRVLDLLTIIVEGDRATWGFAGKEVG